MNKKLESLRWTPLWISYIGCLKGCLDFLGIDHSTGWLFGGTGHVFLMNICEGLDLSGPTALKTDNFIRLGLNLGYKTHSISSFKNEPCFKARQQQAWDEARAAIDRGLPCYGWTLDVRYPEFYVINGYDESGYYFSGPGSNNGAGPKPWRELGDDFIGWLQVQWLEPTQPADAVTVVRDALDFALAHAGGGEQWVWPDYRSGLAGFDLFISELEAGKANWVGIGLNAGNWSECRDYAIEFLLECQERLGSKMKGLLDEALDQYSVTAANLSCLVGLFPFDQRRPWHMQNRERVALALECLRKARKSEESGLRALEKIRKAL